MLTQHIVFLPDMASCALWEREGFPAYRKKSAHCSWRAILDWFHLTMKLTVLGQFGKGLVQCEAVLGEAIRDQVERLKWSLWHGQVDKALGKIDDLETSMEPFSETYARL